MIKITKVVPSVQILVENPPLSTKIFLSRGGFSTPNPRFRRKSGDFSAVLPLEIAIWGPQNPIFSPPPAAKKQRFTLRNHDFRVSKPRFFAASGGPKDSFTLRNHHLWIPNAQFFGRRRRPAPKNAQNRRNIPDLRNLRFLNKGGVFEVFRQGGVFDPDLD